MKITHNYCIQDNANDTIHQIEFEEEDIITKVETRSKVIDYDMVVRGDESDKAFGKPGLRYIPATYEKIPVKRYYVKCPICLQEFQIREIDI